MGGRCSGRGRTCIRCLGAQEEGTRMLIRGPTRAVARGQHRQESAEPPLRPPELVSGTTVKIQPDHYNVAWSIMPPRCIGSSPRQAARPTDHGTEACSTGAIGPATVIPIQMQVPLTRDPSGRSPVFARHRFFAITRRGRFRVKRASALSESRPPRCDRGRYAAQPRSWAGPRWFRVLATE